jgi:hypothetical protein
MLMVGGRRLSRTAITVATSSTAPAPPRRCPVIDFVALIAIERAAPQRAHPRGVRHALPEGLECRAREFGQVGVRVAFEAVLMFHEEEVPADGLGESRGPVGFADPGVEPRPVAVGDDVLKEVARAGVVMLACAPNSDAAVVSRAPALFRGSAASAGAEGVANGGVEVDAVARLGEVLALHGEHPQPVAE